MTATMETTESTSVPDSPVPPSSPTSTNDRDNPISESSTAVSDNDSAAAATRRIFAAVRADVPGCTVAVGREGEVIGRYGAGIAEVEIDGIGRVLSRAGGWAGFGTLFLVAPEQRIAVAMTCTSPDPVALLDMTFETELLTIWVDAGAMSRPDGGSGGS